MKSIYCRKCFNRLRDSEGKGMLGCIFAIILFIAGLYVAITLGPIYYTNMSFETDLKNEASRAGARFLEDETVVKEILELGRRHEIKLKRENIKVERFGGQIQLAVEYSVFVDFVFFERTLNYQVKASSFTGAQ
jgi:hypothetical protein